MIQVVLTGDVRGGDIRAAIEALRARPEVRTHHRIWDMRGVTDLDLGPADYQAFVQVREAIRSEGPIWPVRHAVVTAREWDHEMAEVITLIFKPLELETRLFSDMDEARAWIEAG